MTIRWADPPEDPRGGRTKFAEFFDALRENPGKWAVFKDDAKTNGSVHNINGGTYKAIKDSTEFEATSRQNADLSYTIYARKRP